MEDQKGTQTAHEGPRDQLLQALAENLNVDKQELVRSLQWLAQPRIRERIAQIALDRMGQLRRRGL